SSRNRYLTAEQRQEATVLFRALNVARERIADGERDASRIADEIESTIRNESQGRTDYVQVVSMDTVRPLETIEPGNTLIALAAYWGETRLIDNIRV
ncbi:pantoate--beta-alanine ligase, partial [bacterium]|nr:pantoate--beta-alanine ligase [bacterium]